MIDPGLNDKLVLITGVNNPQGFGGAIARGFCYRGIESVFALLSPERYPCAARRRLESYGARYSFYYRQQTKSADEVLGEIHALGAQAYASEVDFSDASLIPLLFDQAEGLLGPDEVMVNMQCTGKQIHSCHRVQS
jgi:3-oxoacyl-[acyl-carrier protein] reductase